MSIPLFLLYSNKLRERECYLKVKCKTLVFVFVFITMGLMKIVLDIVKNTMFIPLFYFMLMSIMAVLPYTLSCIMERFRKVFR